MGVAFTIHTSDSDESYPVDYALRDIAEYIAQNKARAVVGDVEKRALIIAADTIVCSGKEVMGKPATKAEAREMLRQLSGKKHNVITGCAFHGQDEVRRFSVVTDVFMKELSDEEIDYYINHFQPFDKAGAYAIQEWIGMIGIDTIHGCYFNVVGLPVKRLWKELENVAPHFLPTISG
jgi:septum formation protein